MLKYFENFNEYAFRLELLQKYSVESELKSFSDFFDNGKIDPNKNLRWHKIISGAKQRGAIINRVHVIRLPLSDYLKYELEEYKFNIIAGENIFLLNKNDFESDINFDFWLFDDKIVLKMNYNQNGEFLSFEKITKDISKYIKLKNKLLAVSKKFE